MKKLFFLFSSIVCAILIFLITVAQRDSLRSLKYNLTNASDTLLSGYDSLQTNSGLSAYFPKASPRCSITHNNILRYSTREKRWVLFTESKLSFHDMYTVKKYERVTCDNDSLVVIADEKSLFHLTRSFFKGIGFVPHKGNYLIISKAHINHIESDVGTLLVSTNDLVRAEIHSQENEMKIVITTGSAVISFQPNWKKTSAKLYLINQNATLNILLKSGQKKLEKGHALMLNSRGDHLETAYSPPS